MATLLSRIFGKKTVEPAPVRIDNNELDTRALKPLMEQKAPVSKDPKDLTGAWTMEQVTTVFPSAQRALFQKYHVGGCSSCGFQPTDTLSTVALNHGLDVNEVIDHIQKSQEMEKDLEIMPKETAELLKQGRIKLLDVRSPEEYAIANVAGSVLVDQAVAQDHGMRSLDAAAYLRGHGFVNVKSMCGGIDAWAEQIDSSLARY